jgi:hypothetical protein
MGWVTAWSEGASSYMYLEFREDYQVTTIEMLYYVTLNEYVFISMGNLKRSRHRLE